MCLLCRVSLSAHREKEGRQQYPGGRQRGPTTHWGQVCTCAQATKPNNGTRRGQQQPDNCGPSCRECFLCAHSVVSSAQLWVRSRRSRGRSSRFVCNLFAGPCLWPWRRAHNSIRVRPTENLRVVLFCMATCSVVIVMAAVLYIVL